MGSTFHLSHRSGETLTRLAAAQGLCSMEQIESIVFFFFFFFFLSNWRGTVLRVGGAQLGRKSRGLGPAWYTTKAKGCIRKPAPPTPDLKGSLHCLVQRLKAVPGWWVVRGGRWQCFLGMFSQQWRQGGSGSGDAQGSNPSCCHWGAVSSSSPLPILCLCLPVQPKTELAGVTSEDPFQSSLKGLSNPTVHPALAGPAETPAHRHFLT